MHSYLENTHLVSIAIANKHFYWSRGWLIEDKEALRWAGRLFGFVGVLIIVVGVRDLWLAN